MKDLDRVGVKLAQLPARPSTLRGVLWLGGRAEVESQVAWPWRISPTKNGGFINKNKMLPYIANCQHK